MDQEPRVNVLTVRLFQYSKRLTEMLCLTRRFTTAFNEGVNVIAEEVARMMNFNTGSGINFGLRGSESSEELIYRIAAAMDQNDIFEALFAEIRL